MRNLQLTVNRYIISRALWLGAALLLLGWPALAPLARWLPIPPWVVEALQRIFTLAGWLVIGAGLFGTFIAARNWVGALERWLAVSKRAALLLTGMVMLYFVGFTAFTWQRYYFFNAAGFDLGLQTQVVWNTAQGAWFATTLETGNYLGDHFQPLLALLAIPYRVYPSVLWLLAFQSLSLALGAVPLYILARRRLHSPLAALVLALVYLLYPSVGYINRFDFHFEVVVVPLLLAAWEAIDRGKLGLASLWLGLALFGKEEIGLTVAMLGVATALQFRYRRFGLIWFAVGVGYAVMALFVLIPALRSAPSDTLARYGWLGATPMQILQTIILQPMLVLRGFYDHGWFYFLLRLFAPVAFTPLFSPVHLLALAPSLGYNLLAQFSPQHSTYYQYVAPAIPVIFIGAVYGVARLLAEDRHWAPAFWQRQSPALKKSFILIGLLAFSLLAFWHSNPLADQNIVTDAWTRQRNEPAVRAALATIPPQAAVATTNRYAPHLAHRRDLFVYYQIRADTSAVAQAEVVLLNLADTREANDDEYRRLLTAAAQAGFCITFYQDSAVVLQRNAGDCDKLEQLQELYRR